jgi:hypothetical protein
MIQTKSNLWKTKKGNRILLMITVIDSSSFEINLSAFYPGWPEELEIGDQKILNILNLIINKNQEKFNFIEKLYFDYVDHFDFVKIIDKSNAKN